MNLGRWDDALLKSVWLSSLGLPVFYLFYFMVGQAPDIASLVFSFIIYIFAFILLSIVGWALIGFPAHWLICKFTSKNYLYYALIPSIFICLGFYHSSSLNVLGVAALVQALLFRFFVFKAKT